MSVNKLARAVTEWRKACDKRLARLTSYINQTVNSNNFVMWVTRHNNADWDCFKVLILQKTGRFKINIRRNSLHFRKPNICAKKLDVQETNLSFTQFYGS